MSNYLRKLGRLTAIFNWLSLGLMIALQILGYNLIAWTLFAAQVLATIHFFIRLYLELKRNEKRPVS